MNFFTAQKHASFAAKLFSAVGFDFSKALAANDAEALKSHLATQSPAPVAALFSNANLDLETLLAAGPDSLKAHLASLDNAEQIQVLGEELTNAKTEIAKFTAEHTAATAKIAAFAETFCALGINDAEKTDAAGFKNAFDVHVSKQVTLANAKIGHPPVQHLALDTYEAKAIDQAKADATALADYNKLVSAGPEKKTERLDYFKAHGPAIERAITRLRRGE